MRAAFWAASTILAFAGLRQANANETFSLGDPPRPVTISVLNRADVPVESLTAGEGEAQRIFRKAGLEITWRNCSSQPAVRSETTACGPIGIGHLVAEILPQATEERLRFHLEILGTAVLHDQGNGFYCYLFYDRVERLARTRPVSNDRLLGHVLAHEIGHLLLGSNSHPLTGIMSGQWSGDGMRRVSEGTMFFSQREAMIMRERLKPAFSNRVAGPPEAK